MDGASDSKRTIKRWLRLKVKSFHTAHRARSADEIDIEGFSIGSDRRAAVCQRESRHFYLERDKRTAV